MGPTVRADGANRDRAKAELSKLFSGLSAASLGGGVHRGPNLFDEIKRRGYVGSFSNLERLLAKWRRIAADAPPATVMPTVQAVDPTTGWLISPIVAAALCIKPRASLNPEQAAKVEALKGASADFVVMRQLAMRLRGLFEAKAT